MALNTEVTARYGAQFLVNLTNPSLPTATTIDAARLLAACTDTEADFPIYAGVTYDDDPVTNPTLFTQHIAVAVEGVIAKLAIRTGTGGQYANALHDSHVARMRDFALIAGRDRVRPKTESVLIPNSEQRDNLITRPDFDRERFHDLIPDAPPD